MTELGMQALIMVHIPDMWTIHRVGLWFYNYYYWSTGNSKWWTEGEILRISCS